MSTIAQKPAWFHTTFNTFLDKETCQKYLRKKLPTGLLIKKIIESVALDYQPPLADIIKNWSQKINETNDETKNCFNQS